MLDDGQLLVRAPAGVHARVKDILAVFEAVQRRRVRLVVHELRGTGPLPGAVLSAAQVDALLAAAAAAPASIAPASIAAASIATVGADVPWLSERGRSVRYVRDYEVEVAEKANIADPKLDAFFVGTRLGACVTPLPDGRLLVRAGLHAAVQEGPLRARQLPGRDLGAVHLPALHTVEARASAVLAPDGGLVLAGDRGETVWLLRVRPEASPVLQAGSAAAVPLGHLAVVPLGAGGRRDLVVRPGDEWLDHRPDRQPPAPIAALERLLGADPGVDPRHARVFGSHLVLVDEPGLQARVETACSAAAAELRTVSLTFRIGHVPQELAQRHASAQAGTDDLAAALTREALVATLPGHHFVLALGREQAFVRDYEVEIAAKAAVANPVVDTAFAGYRLSGVVAAGREAELQLDLQWSDVPASLVTDLANPDLGAVDTPVTVWTEASARVPLRTGAWQVAYFGGDPASEDRRVLVVLVRAE
jgi:hypothetical protein